MRGQDRITSTEASCGRSASLAVAARTSTRIIGVPFSIPAAPMSCSLEVTVAPCTVIVFTPMSEVQPAA